MRETQMSAQQQSEDGHRVVSGRLPGLYHISEILPDLLATIAPTTECNQDDCQRPSLAPFVPGTGVLVEA
jgi:hypothetical protein